MVDAPTPRSFPSIVGDITDDYLARLDSTQIAPGVKDLKPGSSIFAIIEAVAQSEARNSQDLLNVLDINNIDKAKGAVLDKIGRDEKV